jgi:thiopeptide-type bacteriocin biosynthesis domain
MPNTQRYYIPGSKWLYIKLYTGSKTADKLLTNELYRVIEELKKKELISKWFFLRYTDPHFHLRVRFQLKRQEDTGEVIGIIYKRFFRLVNDNIMEKIQLDTYKRELERYHPLLINEAETLFYYDSECIMNVLKQNDKSSNASPRWMIAVKMIDALLSDFAFDTAKKQDFMNNLAQGFKKEFGFNEYNAKQFNHKYRDSKKAVESSLKTGENELPKAVLSPIKDKSKNARRTIRVIKKKAANEAIVLEPLVSSYIHMMMNRLFISRNRQYELIIYDFLYRYYTSEIAKEKYAKK